MVYVSSAFCLKSCAAKPYLSRLFLGRVRYLVAIAAPFAGMILQIVLAEHDLRVTREVANNILGSVNASDVRLTEEFNWLYLSVSVFHRVELCRAFPPPAASLSMPAVVLCCRYTTVIYSSCLASAISNERFNRAVFIIQCALSDQRAALITERDSTR